MIRSPLIFAPTSPSDQDQRWASPHTPDSTHDGVEDSCGEERSRGVASAVESSIRPMPDAISPPIIFDEAEWR